MIVSFMISILLLILNQILDDEVDDSPPFDLIQDAPLGGASQSDSVQIAKFTT